MRLVDTDKEIVKLETEIKQQQEVLEYWKLRLQHDRSNADVYRKVGYGRDRIKEAKKKIEYLKSIPDAVLEGAVMDGERILTWIPADRPPETDEWVMLSVPAPFPAIGQYKRETDGSGAYFLCDSTEPCIKDGIIVNAWMPFPNPKRYKED